MVGFSAFSGSHVRPDFVRRVPAPAYDSMSRHERRLYLESHPESYTLVTRSPGDGGPDDDASPDRLIEIGGEALERILASGAFVDLDHDAFFLYRLTRHDHVQLGIVGVIETADYLTGQVKRHEQVSEERAAHLSKHFELLGVHSSPIALGYRADPRIRGLLDQILAETSPVLDFVSGDGLAQAVWVVDDREVCAAIQHAFESHDFYIMDGHHRAAAAGEVAKRIGNPRGRYMLGVAFADDRVNIEPFHRRVAIDPSDDLGVIVERLTADLDLRPAPNLDRELPSRPGEIGVYVDGSWWCGQLRDPISDSPLDVIDPVRLQKQILGPILGVDPELSKGRISYFLDDTDRHVLTQSVGDREILFVLQSVTPAQVFAVADAGLDMPPKSTYVTPKPRSGVFLRRF